MKLQLIGISFSLTVAGCLLVTMASQFDLSESEMKLIVGGQLGGMVDALCEDELGCTIAPQECEDFGEYTCIARYKREIVDLKHKKRCHARSVSNFCFQDGSAVCKRLHYNCEWITEFNVCLLEDNPSVIPYTVPTSCWTFW